MAATQTFVTLSDGAKILVRLLGDAEDKSKPLFIVLHGAPGLSSHLEPEKSFGFLATRYRVLVYDARGSGESDLKEPFNDERWIADVDELRCVYESRLSAIGYHTNSTNGLFKTEPGLGTKRSSSRVAPTAASSRWATPSPIPPASAA